MHNVRSRAGVVALTTGAVVLLALPVVAAGQVPGVGEVVGGVEETVKGVAPAPVPALQKPPVNAPAAAPAPAPAPAAPAPKQQNAAPRPAPPTQARSAPAPAAQRRSAPGASNGRGERAASRSASGFSKRARGASDGGGRKDRASKASAAKESAAKESAASAGEGANASQDGGAPTDVEIASQAVDAPEEANPSTLPFTGLQLALVGALGLVAVASGMALRRGARSAG